MNEFQLKYGTNPNQKPARIFMADGSDLPVTILNGKPGKKPWASLLLPALSMFPPPVPPLACHWTKR